MFYQLTTATQKIQKLHKRIRAVQGGTSASKTVSIIILLIEMSQMDETPKLTSIVSETFPHLRRGAMREFLEIMQSHNYFKRQYWDKTNSSYTFETGSQIEFFSADQPSKAKGPRRDRLFINEADNVPYEAFDQLEVRTKDIIFLDWNPSTEFWYYDKVANRDDCEHLVVTYKDNEALPDSIVKSIEKRQSNPVWWKVYGEGQLGEIETRIYKDWDIIDAVPDDAQYLGAGLDFGYTNDPTAIIDVYRHNNRVIVDEVTYQKGLFNNQIADILKGKNAIIVADSAEPKSIAEIALHGINIVAAKKGPGSVKQGINFVQSQNISITKRSVNIIKEYRNFIWFTDKNGKVINEIDPGCLNHAMDALRYKIAYSMPTEEIVYSHSSSLRLDPRTGYPL